MSDNVTLKPCPFCGGEGAFYRESGSYGYYPSKTGVQCGNGDCLVQPKVSFDDEGYDWEKRKHIQLDSKAEAITAWNTRAQQSGQTEAELLREALHRQCDNMAFVLNRVDLKTWHERFTVELAEDRTHLSQGEGK